VNILEILFERSAKPRYFPEIRIGLRALELYDYIQDGGLPEASEVAAQLAGGHQAGS